MKINKGPGARQARPPAQGGCLASAGPVPASENLRTKLIHFPETQDSGALGVSGHRLSQGRLEPWQGAWAPFTGCSLNRICQQGDRKPRVSLVGAGTCASPSPVMGGQG